MKSILVTNTSNKVQSEVLLARPDLQVTFVTEGRFVDMYPSGIDVVVVEDLNNPSGTMEALMKQRECSQYSAVVSLSERAAPAGAYMRTYLGLAGPSFETVLNCTNKYTMKRRFAAAGLPTADYFLASTPSGVAEAGKKIGWPIIVKPVIGGGADQTFVFATEEELLSSSGQEYLNRLHAPSSTSAKRFPVIVERFLQLEEEYHCDGYVEDGCVVYVQISRYVRPVLDYASEIHGSYTIESSDPMFSFLQDMHARTVAAVGLTNGVTHFEVLKAADGVFAGEIACRPGGAGIRRMLQLHSGFDSWAAHITASLGEKYTWESNDLRYAGKQIAELLLPTQLGTIASISTPEDFASVPGLIEVDMKVKPGDVVTGLIDSSAICGLVFAQISGQQDLDLVIKKISESFHIQTC